jgi:D-amino-acid dehydrogenase
MTLYEELVTLDDLDFGFENKGILHVFNSEDGLAHGQHEADLLETAGIEVQRLNADEVHEIEPNILPSVIGGVFYPGDAHLIPDRFVHQLAHLVESQGVRIKTGTEVLGFERSGSQVQRVITTRGNFPADQIVLATGAWSPDVGQDLGYRLPIQAAKGYSLTFKRPSASLTLPITLGERKVVLTPMGETLRFGGTLELAGLDLSVNRRRVATVQGAARDYLRHMDDLELVEIWRGLRPLTPDTLPIIGRSERLENLIFATGHGMLGMSLGPITGQLVAQIVTGETPSIDLTPLRAERFE